MILEGGQATELERIGCDLNHHLWSAKILLEDAEKIRRVHRLYLEAGADIITTATYQASYPGFSKAGLSNSEIEKVFLLALETAFEAKDEFWSTNMSDDRPEPFVAVSIGPYGAYLADGSEYSGDYEISDDELYEFHLKRIKTLMKVSNEKTKIDLLAIETIPCLNEAIVLSEILKELPGVYAWLSFSAESETSLSDGSSLADAVKEIMGNDQIATVGVNCTKPEFIPEIINLIKNLTTKNVIVYPNSGEGYDYVDKVWDGNRSDVKNYYKLAQKWHNEGAGIIGGCCRTTPEDISQISKYRNDMLDV